MAAHSYQHTRTGAAHVPTPLRWLIVGVAASIVLLVALPLVMVINRADVDEAIIRETPGITGDQLGWAFMIVMVYTIGLHALDLVLLVWLTPRVLRGRQWARIALTAYLVIATFFSIENSAGKGPMFLWTVIPTDLIHLVMIILLWVPRSVRTHFAAPSSGTTPYST